MLKTHKLQSNPSLQTLLLLLSLLIFANTLCVSWNNAVKFPSIDFFTWWVVPHALSKQNIQNIYSEQGRNDFAQTAIDDIKSFKTSPAQKLALKAVLEIYDGQIITTATPFFYSALSRIVSRHYRHDRIRFIILSLACSTASFFILGRMLGYPWTAVFLISSFFLAFYAPCLSDLKVGNCNQIQLFMFSLFIWFFSRTKNFYTILAAGFILGLTIMLKPNMVFIAVFSILLILIKRDFTKLPALTMGIFISILICVLEGIMYFRNPRIWQEWLATLSATIGYSFTLKLGNYSLTKMIFDASGLETSVIFYLMIILIFIILILNQKKTVSNPNKSFRHPRGDHETIPDAFIIYGFSISSLLLASGLVWNHYYVLMIPVLFYLLQPQAELNISGKDFQIKWGTGLILLLLSKHFTNLLDSEFAIALTYNLTIAGVFGLLLFKCWKHPVLKHIKE